MGSGNRDRIAWLWYKNHPLHRETRGSMLVRQAVLCLVSVVGLVGCATKTFTEKDYDYWGYHWQVIPYCNNKGLIPPDLAETGDNIIKRRLATARFEKETFHASAKKYSTLRVNEQICRQIETNILGWEKQRNQERQDARETNEALRSATESIRAATPKQTYCTKMGNQVFCNTY